MCLGVLMDSVICSFVFRPQGTVLVYEDAASSGVPLSS